LIESKKLAEGDDDMDGFEADTEEEEEEEADMGDAEDGDEADSLRLQKLAAVVSLFFTEFSLTWSMLL
jgi:importin-7